MTEFKLLITALFPLLVSVVLYYADQHCQLFRRIADPFKQMLYGLIFGLVAICGTEFGINIDGAIINARDAGPLCASLIFGGPAGIIAGIIGGLERWFCVYWGGGTYTRLACSLATVLSGIFGAALRYYIFDNKKPSWGYGLLAGLVMEILHMLLVFLTNMYDIATAFSYVKQCALPMILLNSVSVMGTVFMISLLGQPKRHTHQELKKLAQTFQRSLATVIAAAFVITMAFSFFLQTELARSNAQNLLALNLIDLRQEIQETSHQKLLTTARRITSDYESVGNHTKSYLKLLCIWYDVSEINIIDQNGVIINSSNDDFIGFHMEDGEQSKEFLVLLDGTEEYVQKYGPISFGTSVNRKYAGIRMQEGGFIQVGYDAEQFQSDISEHIAEATHNRHIGESGHILIANAEEILVSDLYNNEGSPLEITGFHLTPDITSGITYFNADVYGVPSYCLYAPSEGYHIIAAISQQEAFFQRDVSVYLTIFMESVILAILFILIYYLVKKLVVDKIKEINESLSQITGGNLDVTIDVRTNEEFASLSDDINSTVTTLKRYIDEAAARIDQELEFAREIQRSSLPNVFPAYPNRQNFDIYAQMTTAKEVGGDFYDFYLLDHDHLVFLVADVSGKGIPAAMFMMTAKTLLKSLVEAGHEIQDVFTFANDKLCENNEADMFLTAWMGILDLRNGHLEFVNAGHNPPLLYQNGAFTYLRTRPNLVLAGMDGIQYQKQDLILEPGDRICLYTDGVTEASDSSEQLYGEERLLHFVNQHLTDDVTTLCQQMESDVNRFVGDAPQYDDITILAMQYNKTEGHD